MFISLAKLPRRLAALSLFLLTSSCLVLQGCQSLPSNFAFSKSTANQETTWNQLTSSQQLSQFRHYSDAAGLNQLTQAATKSDWRFWQEPSLPDYDLWDRLRDNFGLDISSNDPRVLAEINWYSRHQGYFNRVTERASRYMFHVIEEIEQRNLPGELALLPIVESAYDPFAYSHGRASGMWQFIPGTARHFGLENNWWYDGRRDVLASTDAALTYLTQLHRRFDDWHLALASYNSGGGNVNRALRHNRNAGGNGTFWELKLHPETSAYVPKMIALARIIANPEEYGLTLNPLPNKPYFAAVNTQGQLDLALAAQLAEISINELYLLNPGFSQWATSPEGPHRLLVPVANAPLLEEQLAQLPPQQRMSWQRYKVKSGDSLLTIARQFHTTPNLIKEANQLRSNLIRAGQEMLIPIPSQSASEYALSEPQRLERTQNRDRNGTRVDHQVRSGDSFWILARNHKVSVRELASWNNMAPNDPLIPGQRLVIWSRAQNASAQTADRSIIRRVNYTVRNGDNLANIASRFKVSVGDIARWNSLNPNRYLQPGQNLTLHVDVTRN